MLTTKKKPASIKPTIKSGKNRVSLNWTQLEAVLTGVSAIDLPSLAIRTHQDAKNFALEYGFDVDDPLSMQEVVRVHREAVEFIDEYFLSPAQRALFSDEVRARSCGPSVALGPDRAGTRGTLATLRSTPGA